MNVILLRHVFLRPTSKLQIFINDDKVVASVTILHKLFHSSIRL